MTEMIKPRAPSDVVNQKIQNANKQAEPASKPIKAADMLKMMVMTPVSLLCAFYIAYGILDGHATLPGSPVILLLAFCAVVFTLGMLEGLQIALLEVEEAKLQSIRYFFPQAYRCHQKTLGTGMRQWLCGRQVFVLFSCYICAQLTTFPTFVNWPFTDEPLPEWFKSVVVKTGLPGALIVVAIGQLVPQLIAATHPLHVMRMPLAWFMVRVSMLFQMIGITHFAWGVTSLTCSTLDRRLERRSAANPELVRVPGAEVLGHYLTGRPTELAQDDVVKNNTSNKIKYFFSTVATIFAFAIMMTGVLGGYSRLEAHPVVNLLGFCVTVTLLAYLEGLQVALLKFDAQMHGATPQQVAYVKEHHKSVYTCWKLCCSEGCMERFLCGRQVFVIFTVFLCAQITTFPTLTSLPFIGVTSLPYWFRVAVFDTGLPGALIVVACGQLIPQLVGEQHPMFLMGLPGAVTICRLSLGLESMGLTHFAWVVTYLLKYLMRVSGSIGTNPRYSYNVVISEQKRMEMSRFAQWLQQNQSSAFGDMQNISGEAHMAAQWESLASIMQQLSLAEHTPISVPTADVVKKATTTSHSGNSDTTLVRQDSNDTSVLALEDLEAGLEAGFKAGMEKGADDIDATGNAFMNLPGYPNQPLIAQASAVGGLDSTPSSQERPSQAVVAVTSPEDGKKEQVLPSARQLARHCLQQNEQIPRFLLPKEHPLHIPPHIVAYELMRMNMISQAQQV